MATTATIQCRIDINRTLTTGVENVATPNIRLAVGEVTSLTASTTPDAENGVASRLSLTAGSLTVDLTAISDVNGATTTLTGKIVRALLFHNRGAATMTFAKGASNGLDSLSGTWSMALLAGEKRCIDLTDCTAPNAISASNKTIDVTGTGTDSFDIGVVVG